VGGRPDATGTGYFTTGERAEVLADGDLGPFVALSYNLNTARAFYVLLTNQGQDSPGFNPDDPDIPLDKSLWEESVYLIAIQGDDEHTGNANSGLLDFEVSEIITSDGDNDVWVVQSDTPPGGRATHGLGALLFFDFLFVFGGVEDEDPGSDPVPMGSATSRFEYDEEPADPADIINTYQSSSASFDVGRGYYEMVRLNGYVWTIGGNNGSGPEASIEQTLQ
jgi:hypothetical protein